MSYDFEELAKVRIDPDLLELALRVLGSTEPGDPLYGGTMFKHVANAFTRWTGKESASWDAADVALVHATVLRLRALSRLVDAGDFPMPDGQADKAWHRGFAAAVCAAELFEENGKPAFDPRDVAARARRIPTQ